MTLKERIISAESKGGKILMKICALALSVVGVIQINDQVYAFIPPGFIPDNVKGVIGVLAVIGLVGAKFTVEKKQE